MKQKHQLLLHIVSTMFIMISTLILEVFYSKMSLSQLV